MVLESRELLNEMFELFAVLGPKFDLGDMIDAAKYDLTKYLIYLATANGQPTGKDCSLIREVSGINASPEFLENYIRDDSNYLSTFVYTIKIPLVFSGLVLIDNTAYEQNMRVEKGASEFMVLLYKALGTEILNINGYVNKKAETRFDNYIGLMEEYLQANLLSISAAAQFDNKASHRFCGKCGTPVQESDSFCTRCGARYED